MKMRVIPCNKRICDLFVTEKHYSRKPSIFWAGFALVIDDTIQGVCVFGQPSPPLQKYAFTARDFKFYELSRLVVQTKEKNAASFLVGNALRKLQKPAAIVSFADTAKSHAGIVYQATNWYYTGATVSHDTLYLVEGEVLHPMTIRDRFQTTEPKKWAKANNIPTIRPMQKHRYFFFVGSKNEKAAMLQKLRYPVINTYPKMDQNRYDDGKDLYILAKDSGYE